MANVGMTGRTMLAMASFAVAMAPVASCSGDDDGADAPAADVATTDPLPIAPPASSPVDDGPFCRAMVDLGTDDSTDLGVADVVEVYVDVLDDVPAEIRPEFDVVVANLRGIAAGGEGVDPAVAEEATIALAAYVELRCRNTAMSPLPPPTVPGGDPEPTED